MPHRPADMVEENVARLQAISERRNVLLREMHQMIRRRNNLGSVLTSDIEDEEEEDLQVFLQRFTMTRDNPEAGSITNLSDIELFSPPPGRGTGVSSRPPSSTGKPSSSRTTRSRQRPDPAAFPAVQIESSRPLLRHQELRLTSAAADTSLDAMGDSLEPLPSSISIQIRQESDDEEDELDLLRKSSPLHAPSPPTPSGHDGGHTDMEVAPNSTEASATKDEPFAYEPGNVVVERDAVATHPLANDTGVKGHQEAAELQKSSSTEPTSQMDVDKPPVSTVNPRELIVERPKEVSEDVVMSDSQVEELQQTESGALFVPHTAIEVPLVSWHAHHKFVPAVAALTKRRVIVLDTHSSGVPDHDYVFSEPPPPQPTPPASTTFLQRRLQFKSDFSLPSLKAINPEYTRKPRSVKRKREKEREGGGSRKETGRDDSVPLGLNKWAATLNANPVWKKVSRAPKCLSTREWAVAMSELRLIRAIDRIESLKREGRWSFRQPKKQRAIGGVPKTHWDHLMDEMKWMRVDFREERKWKMALAYNLSTAVLDWHAASTTQVRVAKGICVRWKRPRPEDQDHEVEENIHLDPGTDQAEMELNESGEGCLQRTTSLLGVDYGSDDEDEDEDEDDPARDPQNLVDALEPSALIEDALDNSQNIQPKTEEVEDRSALVNRDTSGEVAGGGTSAAMVTEETKPDTSSGLKMTSNDPVLPSQPTPSSNSGDTELFSSTYLKSSAKSNIYAPFREIIAYSEDDKLFLDLEEFDIAKLTVPGANIPDDTLLPPPDLTAIFPDLQVLSLSDPSPVVQSATDGKKRSDKRADRDDPSKRPDDILYTRLYPTGNFMMSKPTLIGPLRPSKNWKNDRWLPLDETPVAPEADVPVRISDDSVSELFDSRSSSAPSVAIAMQMQTAFLKDKEGRKRTADHLWSNADDGLLKSLIDKYPNNWVLISECFNASRLTISTDKRTPRDCLERWRDKWAPEIRRPAENLSTVDATPPPASNQMTTRGVKRLASASVSSTTPVGMATGSEPRKRRRHLLVQDTIRKAGKKRAEALQKMQAAQRKPPAIHETHAQYSKLPKRTPAELSRVKADKEARELQELHQARKRQEEINRQTLLARIGANGAAPTQQQGMPQQQQQQVTTPVQRPVGAGIPPPTQIVPPIRSQVNISQQQRTNTPSMQAGGRLSQQMIQAQVRAVQQQQQQAQVHAQALAQAQNQTQSNVVAANGAVPANNPHLSPPYATRDVTSPPAHVSPPHSSAVPSTVNSPRPPSAQAHPLLQAAQVPGNAGTRGGYFLPNMPNVQGYTHEQLHTALRLQQQHTHQQQQQQQQQQQPLAGFPTQS